jgi:hypothetical protein
MGKGRKRKPGKREPNGKLSRRKDEKQARRTIDEQANMAVGKEARVRVHGEDQGVTADNAGTELAGSVCGRLLLQGSISSEHMDAAKAFQETYAAYQRVMDSPRPPKAVEIGGATGGSLREITPEQANRAKERWAEACLCLARTNQEHRTATIYAACDYIVLRDQYLPHLFGDLRLGLNALARHYGLVARRAA